MPQRHPYYVELKGTSHGFPFVVMAMNMGHRCGYVGVPQNHPLYGVRYDEAHPSLPSVNVLDQPLGKRSPIALFCASSEGEFLEPALYFDVHGGLTYSQETWLDERTQLFFPIQTPQPFWWFGFDCAHCDDAPDPQLMSPEISEVLGRIEAQFTTMDHSREVRYLPYVQQECENLAAQLAALGGIAW